MTLPRGGPSAAQVVHECRRHDVYLRDLSPMSPAYEGRTVRVAVKDPAGNARIVAAFRPPSMYCGQVRPRSVRCPRYPPYMQYP